MADPLSAFIDEVRSSRKYRALELPDNLLKDLFEREISAGCSPKEAVKLARQKLHNIVATYLGDPDYTHAVLELEQAFACGDPAAPKQVCARLLGSHASTSERLPYLEEFYASIFKVTGRPDSILDLACGLNPLAFPWMGLPLSVRYIACDIHRPRLELINRFFRLEGLAPLAEQRDVLVEPPPQQVDAAFFFKEAHRFEQRQRGCNRAFWQAVRTHWLLVSLPAVSLGGHHSLLDRQRRLVNGVLEGLTWPVVELQIGDELVFCIEKGNET
jgi:16S rRNA (guanine(1405)-N(7))-methyltransferase